MLAGGNAARIRAAARSCCWLTREKERGGAVAVSAGHTYVSCRASACRRNFFPPADLCRPAPPGRLVKANGQVDCAGRVGVADMPRGTVCPTLAAVVVVVAAVTAGWTQQVQINIPLPRVNILVYKLVLYKKKRRRRKLIRNRGQNVFAFLRTLSRNP